MSVFLVDIVSSKTSKKDYCDSYNDLQKGRIVPGLTLDDFEYNLSDEEEYSALIYFGVREERLEGLTNNNGFFKYVEYYDDPVREVKQTITTYCKQRFNKAKLIGVSTKSFYQDQETNMAWKVNKQNKFSRLYFDNGDFAFSQRFGTKGFLRVSKDLTPNIDVDGYVRPMSYFMEDEFLQALLLKGLIDVQKDEKTFRKADEIFLVGFSKTGNKVDVMFKESLDNSAEVYTQTYLIQFERN